jgi:phosphoribosyl-AMP cyclohydrolase
LLHFGLAQFGFQLKQELARPSQFIFPFAILPAFMLQEVELLLPGQIAVGDDFSHRSGFLSGKISIQPCRFKAKRLIFLDMKNLEQPNFAKMGGLLPAIVQDAATGEVLMLAFMNEEAWEATLKTGEANYFSRTRNTLWHKGGTSGHVQRIKEIYLDCDNDTVLLKVEQVGGAACHTGYKSCFYRRRTGDDWEVMGTPVFDPKKVYGDG